ncbi:MAG: gamma-glutamyltransferase family protein [Rhodospirillales bacterium]
MAVLPFTTRPEIIGTFGVVTSTHWLATATAMAVLEKGGNAFDAGAACGLALQVVEPHLNGPGGEAPIMVHDVSRGRSEVICGQGPAPAGATMDHYRREGLDMVPGTGLLATCVPGAFDAWMVLLRDYGTMSLADVLSPAISFARDGYPLVQRICDTIATVADLFREHWLTSAAVYLPGGKIPVAGSLFTNRAMAGTYTRLLREAQSAGGDRIKQIEAARKIWSQGFIAEAIDEFCRTNEVMDVSGAPHKGVLTGQDMAKWQASIEAPLAYQYGNYTVLKCGPWSQGPVMLQQLALLKALGFAASDPMSPDFVHPVIEASKLAYADREVFYGDPDFVDVPMDVLLSDAYNAQRAKLIGKQASLELRPGSIEGFGGTITLRRADKADKNMQAGAGEPTVGAIGGAGEPTVGRMGQSIGDTVHFDIIDQAGNMISATPSGGWLQSSPIIPELGFCLGSRAQMFYLDETSPSALMPGKRPRSTLSPGMALRDGQPYLCYGTPGGDQQDQWSTQFFLRHVHAGMNLQEAIDCPAFHTEHFPISFWPRTARPGVAVIEGRMPKATVAELERRGHIVEVGGDWSEGRMTAASRDGKLRKAGANPRGMQGYAIGR